MPERIELHPFLASAKGKPIFDVRTPAEFEHAHIPGAVNLPLFSNDERAVVGTAYKQQGRHEAIKIGLDLIGPRMRSLVEIVEEHVGPPADASPVHVHCWRGGMRSGSVGWLLEMYGYQVKLLDGGYKAFRRWVLQRIEDAPALTVVGGRTGSGKTLLLDRLTELGEPVLDLEGLAHHRGSAFGALGLPNQPMQEHFEAKVAMRLAELEGASGPVWVEDESKMIGRCKVPDGLLAAMRRAPVIALEVPVERRVEILLEIYGDLEFDGLRESFEKIQKRLGGERTKSALRALDAGDLATAARIALEYYDKTYDYGLSKRTDEQLHWLKSEGDSIEILADKARDLAVRITRKEEV